MSYSERYGERAEAERLKRSKPKLGLTAEERFWRHVTKSDGCWLWVFRDGTIRKNQYVRFYFAGRTISAHAFSLQLKLGRPLRDGMEPCHACDTPSCVNPDHLFEGTHHENMLDAWNKGRMPIVTTCMRPEVIARRAATGSLSQVKAWHARRLKGTDSWKLSDQTRQRMVAAQADRRAREKAKAVQALEGGRNIC